MKEGFGRSAEWCFELTLKLCSGFAKGVCIPKAPKRFSRLLLRCFLLSSFFRCYSFLLLRCLSCCETSAACGETGHKAEEGYLAPGVRRRSRFSPWAAVNRAAFGLVFQLEPALRGLVSAPSWAIIRPSAAHFGARRLLGLTVVLLVEAAVIACFSTKKKEIFWAPVVQCWGKWPLAVLNYRCTSHK